MAPAMLLLWWTSHMTNPPRHLHHPHRGRQKPFIIEPLRYMVVPSPYGYNVVSAYGRGQGLWQLLPMLLPRHLEHQERVPTMAILRS